ncbi:hypothetical protein [Aureimonas mangrovi]|uniref:hypothetical protein n=1 Tax=Aureimonas mangrovi TaxID=2758041 RepID=UPI00163DE357|nr:hypothetical protein [Aureimonas mangrovi]
MSAGRCTMGPWNMVQWGDGSDADDYTVTSDESEVVIAHGLSRPDAALIASAPDMLKALRAAVVLIGDHRSTEMGSINAAIAKAEDARPYRGGA